ncbi:MAG TPA: DevR family CRISPR-associated autoregulator [Pseudomonadota bacterium]|nr:DevR family CRISPR-associated autoregulator [Pseudomonadota bacterium]
MSTHVFAAVLTSYGVAANNRGMNEGNTTTLQKLLWNGQVHTTVSAESIRFALRRRLAEAGQKCNRSFNESSRMNEWIEPSFAAWNSESGDTFADDDLLGFMIATGAGTEGGGTDESEEEESSGKKGKGKAKAKAKGSATVRRAVLEITRAVSLTPWAGDVTFNAASPGATPSAQKKGKDNPVPYATEMHATRYQYGLSLTPEHLRVRARAAVALQSICALGEVAGNHGRFLYDFSPESVVFRVTQDPAPRLLYTFEQRNEQPAISSLVRKVKAGDIQASELIIGGSIIDGLSQEERKAMEGAALFAGVMAACQEVCRRLPK